MATPPPAETAGTPEPDRPNTTKRRIRDRHGRRTSAAARTTRTTRTGPRRATGPRFTLGPPKTVPMTPQEYQQAVRAWAVLIAAWCVARRSA